MVMNDIATKQNEQKQLERLAAQRELYSAAKIYKGWQLIFSVTLPILFSVLILKLDSITPYAALYGLILAALDPLIFEYAIRNRREKAAKIQELFDCEVLKLIPSPLKTSNDQMVEDVLIHYDAHKKIPLNIEKIRNWYPVNISVLPVHIARLICQRTNCYWDSRLRKRYSNFIGIFGVGVLIIFLLIGVISNRPFNDLILVASILLPFVQFCLKECKDQSEASQRLDNLVGYAKQIWENDLVKPESELTEISRRLQDEIYDHRSKSPLILDFIYNRFLDKDEKIMNKTAQNLTDDVIGRDLV
jgi:hypothetical protein